MHPGRLKPVAALAAPCYSDTVEPVEKQLHLFILAAMIPNGYLVLHHKQVAGRDRFPLCPPNS
jgi:hypothetical protein